MEIQEELRLMVLGKTEDEVSKSRKDPKYIDDIIHK